MKFKSKIDIYAKLFWSVIFALILFSLAVVIDKGRGAPIIYTLIPIVIIGLSAALCIWILLTSYMNIYKSNQLLSYKAGPLSGNIDIKTIRKIKLNTRLWSGIKIGLSFKKGLIIYYQKYNYIYFTPKQEDEFCTMLKEINPDIEIIH
ncbi:PH domain-containing protein [Flammeovirga agarivorans]|uniref:Uncharacterized protein YyaB-like PH domain-containing protein n=1 Tax=Flammeovirga agarivorans TaxID=2726742 RepID=A0A7X8XYE2_9BACT|nr:PH domain-containing protein [Flammeovirga agarivorans]NLR94129.1 hypothetical protein [Flammeovirga agarivorans]